LSDNCPGLRLRITAGIPIMYLRQSDLFAGLSHYFLKEVMNIAVRHAYQEDEVIFTDGEPADWLFVLVSGHIQLRLDEIGQVVYSSDRMGEAFGWSSLIGKQGYTATAISLAPTVVLKIERQRLQHLLDADEDNGRIFYRQLAATLGKRLLELYRRLSDPESRDANR